LLLLVLLVLSSAVAAAAERPDYKQYQLRLPGDLIDVAVEDLDGDGLKDIVAFCQYTKNGSARSVSIFYQKRGGGFGSEPDQSFVIDPEAVVYDIGDLAKTGRRSICIMRPDGLYAYELQGRSYNTRPVLLIKTGSIFIQRDAFDLPRWPLILNSAPEPALILVPFVNRVEVFAHNGTGYKATGTLRFPTRTSFMEEFLMPTGRLSMVTKMPAVSGIAYNSPSGHDLMISMDDNADIWLRGPSGLSEGLRFRPGLMEVKKDSDSLEAARVQSVDLTGRGKCDIVVTKMEGGVAQTKTLVFIYMRRKDGSFPEKPTQTIITEGVIGPRIIDMTGSGRKDIVLPSVKMGLNNLINMLTSKQVNVTVGFYIQQPSGLYPDRPTREKNINFKLDVSNMGKNARPVMAFGKFTKGPGMGLAVTSKEDRVSIYMPDRYSVISDNPGLSLSVPAPSEIEAVDLNGDGVDDLVMSYKKVKANRKEINVFLSK